MSAINLLDSAFFMSGTEGAILLAVCIAAIVCTVAVVALAVIVILTIRRRKSDKSGEISKAAERVEQTEPEQPAEEVKNAHIYSKFSAEEPSKAAEEISDEVPAQGSAKKVRIVREGALVSARYDKSFTAKLIQSSNEVKEWYSNLKNALLGYKKVTSRISWRTDSINRGRIKLAKFSIRGKTLSLYFALNPDDYADTKYKVERAENKRFEDVPCLYRIKNGRRAKYALELIATLAEKFGLQSVERERVDYYLPYEETEKLLERGLVKQIIYKSDEPAQVEEDGEIVEEVAEEVAEETVDEAVEEAVEEAAAAEVTEEQPVEEVAAEEAIQKTVDEEIEVEELSKKELDDVETYEEKASDEDGVEVVGVMFRRRGRKVYWFDPDGKTWEKGEIALYKSPDNPPQEVIVVDNAKLSPEKLHLPLKPLYKLTRRPQTGSRQKLR